MSEIDLPRRSRGTRALIWLAIIFFALIALLVLIHSIWSWRAGSRMTSLIEALKAKGEPVTIEAIAPKPIPDEQNAYVDVRRAIALMPPQGEADKELSQVREKLTIPLFEDEKLLLQRVTTDTDESLAALKPALNKHSAVNDQLRFASPMISILLPDLNPLRRLANAAVYSAMLDFEADRHDLALETLRLLEPIAKCAGANKSLVGTLVGIGVRAIQSDQIADIAPRLKIGNQPGEAPPALVKQLIADLLDDRALRAEYVDGMQMERMQQIDTFGRFLEGDFNAMAGPGQPPSSSPLLALAAKPIIRDNAVYCIEKTTEMIEIARGDTFDNWAVATARTDQWERELSGKLSNWRYRFAGMLLPSFVRSADTHFRIRTDRQLAATALAVRLFQSDHGGALPESLDKLVPDYLPKLPLDPRTDGKPVGYRGGDDPIIWSAGVNNIDDGGSETPADPKFANMPGPVDRWLAKDAVVKLKGRPREKSAIEKE